MKLDTRLDPMKFVAPGLLALLLSGTAAAEDPDKLYFSLTAGRSSTALIKDDINSNVVMRFLDAGAEQAELTGSTLDDTDIVFGGLVGYSFTPHVALEVGFLDLGQADSNTTVNVVMGPATTPVSVTNWFSTSGPTLALVGSLPMAERFQVFGRGGLYFSDTRIKTTLATAGMTNAEGDKASDIDLFVGIGGGWRINQSYELRIDYQRFLDAGRDVKSDVDLISASLLFH